jgi:outer membrane protein assembly factor BamA
VHAAHAKIGYVTEDAAIESVFDDVSKRATLRIHVAEGPQYQMGRFTVVGGSPEQAKAITGKWKLAAGDVFDGSYITDFQSKVLNAYSHPPHKATLDGAGTDDHLVNVTVTLH